jgi:hypothetical protein
MVVTTMSFIKELLLQLRKQYPHYNFVVGDDFRWSAASGTIFVASNAQAADAAYVLHELAHAVLEHHDYNLDVELLRQESHAWDYAQQTFAPHYNVAISTNLIDNALDSYRTWLHARSTCPNCSQTGLQTKTSTYTCLNCRCSWHPNDARQCALRRYKLPLGS